MKFVIKKGIIYKNSIISPVTHNRIELCISSKRTIIVYFDFNKKRFLTETDMVKCLCIEFLINKMPLLKILKGLLSKAPVMKMGRINTL